LTEFDAPVEAARGGGAYVRLPEAAMEALGSRGRVPVVASFDGVPYRGSTMPMGDGTSCVGILKSIRQQLGVGVGDTVHVTVERDTSERVVEPTPDLAEAFTPEAAAAFERLAPSHRRAYVRWIEEAKRPETRARRVAESVSRLASGGPTP
jgi:hypothetical protein